MQFTKLKYLLITLVLILPPQARCESPRLVMGTQGYLLFAPHIHGLQKTSSTNAGYRVELRALTDLVRWNRLYFSFLTANRTLIERSPAAGFFRLDQIKYILSPDIRLEFDSWLMRISYLHESLHNVSRATLGTTIWMNSLQLTLGTKGSNYLYIWEEFRNNKDRFLNHVDGLAFVAVFRSGKESIWIGRNHDYRYKLGGRLRFQIGSFNRWAYFVGSDVTGWLRETGDWEATGLVRVNVFRKGLKNFAGVYYAYNFYDTFHPDNEQYLGSLGFQVIF